MLWSPQETFIKENITETELFVLVGVCSLRNTLLLKESQPETQDGMRS